MQESVFFHFCRYLATGDSFQSISFSYRVGHSTVAYVVRDTCRALWKCLSNEVMKAPDEDSWKKIATDYWNKWNFPNCVGAIDGKHVLIQAPPNSGSQYFNYKGSHSIILLAVVDANLRFLVLDIGAYGRSSDGGVFANSIFGQYLQQGKMNLPPPSPFINSPPGSPSYPYVFVSDEAFPLKPFLLRPFSGRGLSDEKKIFNYRLSIQSFCNYFISSEGALHWQENIVRKGRE
jgi:hypothetical protein